MNTGNFRQTFSAEFMDMAVRSRPTREWLLRSGSRRLHRFYVEGSAEGLPERVLELRWRAIMNLLRSFADAVGDGRISPSFRRGLVRNFVGQVVQGERERQAPFKERHGYLPPTFLVISPTKRCNLACKGCYAASSRKNDETLTYAAFSRLLREKRDEWGSHFNVISGGEPLMYRSEGKDLFDVMRENSQDYFMLYTNSTLIDREVAQRMAEAGNVTPAISVEGWEKETDARRGRGVYRRIQEAMELLREVGVPFGVSITATRENAETVLSDEFIEHYFERMGAVYGWIFQYMPIGRSYTTELMVTPEQRRWMLGRQLELLEERGLFIVDFWNGGPLSIGCMAAGRSGGYFYVDWNGNIAPCVFFPYYTANLYEMYERGESISSVLTGDFFKTIRSWQEAYLGKRSAHGRMHNLFTPCPIRDHYSVARNIIDHHGAAPLDEEAAQALADPEYRRRMIESGQQVSALLDPIWEEQVPCCNPAALRELAAAEG